MKLTTKYVIIGLGVLLFASLVVRNHGGVYITEHKISNGNTYACIYESRDDFIQTQTEGER